MISKVKNTKEMKIEKQKRESGNDFSFKKIGSEKLPLLIELHPIGKD